jgi:hypothetical protein
MLRITFFLLLLIQNIWSLAADNGFSLGFGTNYGGPLANKTLENASGKSLLGTGFHLAYNHNFSPKLAFVPTLTLDFRHFSYNALERNDTIVEVEMGGIVGNIDTYYQAKVNGKAHTVVGSLNALAEFRYSKRSTLLFGAYAGVFPKRSDNVFLKVIIGEGGFLPDIDSTYNDGANIRNYEIGLSLGGKFYISEKVSIDFLTTRALSPFYKEWVPRNEEQKGMKFFSTYVRVSLNFYLFKNRKCPCIRRY